MISTQVKELLEANYSVEVLDVVAVNRDLFRVETREGNDCGDTVGVWEDGKMRFCHSIRRLVRVHTKPSHLIFAYSAVSVLRDRGFDQVLKIHLTRNEEPFFLAENSYWVLMDWVDGREVDLKMLTDIEEITRDLARAHHYLTGILAVEGEPSGKEWFRWPEKLASGQKHWQKYLNKLNPEATNDFDQMVLANQTILDERINQAIGLAYSFPCQKMFQNEKEVMALVYAQMKERHFLLGFDGRVYFVAPFEMRYDIRVKDLSRWLKRIARTFDDYAQIVPRVLHWYEEERPLSYGEQALLLADFLYPAKVLKIIKRYSEKKKHWPLESYTRKLRRALKSANREYELSQQLAQIFHEREGV